MNENCRAFAEDIRPEDENQTVLCPYCGHYVVLGLPHPDFDNQEQPVSDHELLNLSMRPKRKLD